MIESITLKNFQGHKDTSVDLVPGINVITGETNSGKSSIIRAIGWIHSNPRWGNSVVSYWNRNSKGEPIDETSASVVVNGKPVKRVKNASTNGYVVDDEKLAAIGTSVPDSVSTSLDLSEITFQKQHSPHFLLSDTAGEVSTFLNTVLNLSIIDDTLAKINPEVRSTSYSLKSTEDEISELLKSITKMAYLDEVKAMAEALDDLSNKRDTAKKNSDDLEEIITMIKYHENIVLNGRTMICAISGLIEKTDALLLKKQTTDADIFDLSSIISNIEASQKIIDKKEYVSSMMEMFTKVDTLILSKGEVDKQIEELDRIISAIKEERNKINVADVKLEELKSLLPDECPLCGASKEQIPIITI